MERTLAFLTAKFLLQIKRGVGVGGKKEMNDAIVGELCIQATIFTI